MTETPINNSNMKQVTVIVDGLTGTGKSTIAKLIEDTLREHDIEVTNTDNIECPRWLFEQEQPDRLERIAQHGESGTHVTIQTQHAKLNALNRMLTTKKLPHLHDCDETSTNE